MATTELDPDFPCSLTIDLPLPTARLATAALRALQVDKELSPLVCRAFSTISSTSPGHASGAADTSPVPSEEKTILRTQYKASTNRMLRVAVNGFMENLGVVLQVMEELDVDVLGTDAAQK